MNNSINNFRYSPFSTAASSAGQRRPVVFEGEKTTVTTDSPQPRAKPHSNSQRTAPTQAQERILEARPVKDNEQLFSSSNVLAARSPLAAFAAVNQAPARIGSSVDTYA